ncbi:uncharacterized protein LOC143446052 isoform X1 [Clavelina lepadiformis]|uniref:uncharacterized protein LOC143446052 isoform X1 n=1 Tax=Clavelina lepadiformis TaxID=159417 RepID=UPI004042D17E
MKEKVLGLKSHLDNHEIEKALICAERLADVDAVVGCDVPSSEVSLIFDLLVLIIGAFTSKSEYQAALKIISWAAKFCTNFENPLDQLRKLEKCAVLASEIGNAIKLKEPKLYTEKKIKEYVIPKLRDLLQQIRAVATANTQIKAVMEAWGMYYIAWNFYNINDVDEVNTTCSQALNHLEKYDAKHFRVAGWLNNLMSDVKRELKQDPRKYETNAINIFKVAQDMSESLRKEWVYWLQERIDNY